MTSATDAGLDTERDGMVVPPTQMMRSFEDEGTSYTGEGSSNTDRLLVQGEVESAPESATTPAMRGFFGKAFDVVSGITLTVGAIIPVEVTLGVFDYWQSNCCLRTREEFWGEGEDFIDSKAAEWTLKAALCVCCFPCAVPDLVNWCSEKCEHSDRPIFQMMANS